MTEYQPRKGTPDNPMTDDESLGKFFGAQRGDYPAAMPNGQPTLLLDLDRRSTRQVDDASACSRGRRSSGLTSASSGDARRTCHKLSPADGRGASRSCPSLSQAVRPEKRFAKGAGSYILNPRRDRSARTGVETVACHRRSADALERASAPMVARGKRERPGGYWSASSPRHPGLAFTCDARGEGIRLGLACAYS